MLPVGVIEKDTLANITSDEIYTHSWQSRDIVDFMAASKHFPPRVYEEVTKHQIKENQVKQSCFDSFPPKNLINLA